MVIKLLLAHIQLHFDLVRGEGHLSFSKLFETECPNFWGEGGAEPFLTVQTFSVQTRGGGGGVVRGLDSVHSFVVFFFEGFP